MKADILIVGGGASGLLAAYGAAKTLVDRHSDAQVTLLEKMPRPARKMMITGKGRCNFSNMKPWNDFSTHVRTKAAFVKPAFFNLPGVAVRDLLESYGLQTVVERGDRAFPASYRASDVIDTLVSAARSYGVKIETEWPVAGVSCADGLFSACAADGRSYSARRIILATGGLSYPGTGSTGDGYAWAQAFGHRIRPCFPSLTALVPKGYKEETPRAERWHIDRSTPLSELGRSLCGVQLKNIQLSLSIDGNPVATESGDIDFTDGGIEDPVGFQLSRQAVKALVNGSRARLTLDLKPGVDLTALTERIHALWKEVDGDPRSRRLHEKEKCRILLGKLLPWELIPGFRACHPGILTYERRSRTETKVWVNLLDIAKALKAWDFDLAGCVGYERAVVTAGGVDTDEVFPKTMESRIVPGLYFCGELLDIDSDTGGYNLQTAFSTGFLAGQHAAGSLLP